MCEGFFNKIKKHELSEQRRFRLLGWVTLCGYVDPKKAPKNMQSWWPIEGDITPQEKGLAKLSKKRITFIENRIANEMAKLNKTGNG